MKMPEEVKSEVKSFHSEESYHRKRKNKNYPRGDRIQRTDSGSW